MYGAMQPSPVPTHPYGTYGMSGYGAGGGEPGRPPPPTGGGGGPPPWGGGIPPPPTRFDDMAAMPVSELETLLNEEDTFRRYVASQPYVRGVEHTLGATRASVASLRERYDRQGLAAASASASASAAQARGGRRAARQREEEERAEEMALVDVVRQKRQTKQLWESRNSFAAIRERLDVAWAAVDADAAALYNALVHGTPSGDGAAAAAGGHPGSSTAAASIVLASASASAGAASAAATATGAGGAGGGSGSGGSGSGTGGGGDGGGGTPAAVFAVQVRAYVKLRSVFYLRSNTRRRLPAIFGAATTGARPPSASSYA